MKRFGGRTAVVLATGVAAFATGSSVASAGQPVQDTLRGVDQVVKNVKGQLDQTTKRVLRQRQAPGATRGATPRGATPGSPGGYQPPLHGTNPHGQGTVGTVDLAPSGQRPLSGNPSGAQPNPVDNEEIVVGRARGEKDAAGYHGHITIAALLGNELVGVDTRPGQMRSGPLDAVQQNLLNPLCNNTAQQVCLEALAADSSTTPTSTNNRFAVARAQLGGPTGITTGIAESRGNASEDANCQRSSGSSAVANANAGGLVAADAANSSSSSVSCRDGSGSQTETSSVVGINGVGVPLPAQGCANGTPDTVTTVPLVASTVCNAADLNGVGETVTQAAQRYGVREALTVFGVNLGGVSLVKLTTSASESRSQAPAGPATPDTPDDGPPGDDGNPNDDGPDSGPSGPSGPGGPGGPGDDGPGDGPGDGRGGASQCSDGIDNDGDGRVDFPNDPGCSSAQDDSEANELAFTGMNVLFVVGMGLLLVVVGLRLSAVPRRSRA